MTLDELYIEVQKLTECIHVLEAEKTTEQFVTPLYNKRKEFLMMLSAADNGIHHPTN